MFGSIGFATRIKYLLVVISLSIFHYRKVVNGFTPEHRGHGRLFLDTADRTIWDELLPTGIFHGVTTNPTLLERANEPCTVENLHSMASEALELTNEFMCQAWGSTAEQMYDCGMELSAYDRERIVIKVPVTQQGVEAASRLIRQGNCRVCLTACYDSKQAMIAANVGAEYLAPYLGRMTDAGKNGMQECLQMNQIATGMKSSVRILVASIRQVSDMTDLAAQGMETFTFSPDIARELLQDTMTTKAATVFEEEAAQNSAEDFDEF
mmetsp:Transcript_16310/g.21346  ORF Transcript_16310/g.21346 Transcript_16310/m.21346 type:complete len:266 (+) Transcript_16310:206-1003(+)|eukprot:CAMPEP_0198145214 /NCGR_PEP_ID=MMETSP1443-20131203/21946_1 /TAXON_ID=186043 /ORGANISM="Entomoneis sp., Strain CCMP2396" /LENGTH=265 /DNA_ID=CAMNT_0043808783 /DNA_START=142 /DNA_END=939 /DNA_ORIENTATION=+